MRKIGVSGRAKPVLEKTRKRLTKLGLLMDDGRAWRAQMLPTLPILAVLLLGLAKILVGLSRGKSVGFLLVLCVLTVIIVVHFVRKRPYRRSRWGDLMLDHLRHQNEALRLTGTRRAADLEGHDLALALALFGTGILAGGPLNDLSTALAPPPTAPWWLLFEPRASSWSDSSGGDGGGWSDSGGGGGSDGGGGGSGGGGGCGGCGGGS
jgi:uncharacterized membrane protein YgcG